MSKTDVLHIYTRVSSKGQEDGTSLSTQKEIGIKKSKDMGLSYKVWNEGGKSSYGDEISDRPVMSKLYDEICKGNIKYLWCYNQDRLSRNRTTRSLIESRLLQNECTLIINQSTYDLSDPSNEFMVGILGLVSQLENENRRSRSKLGKHERVKQGFWLGGPTPFGYKNVEKKLEIDEFESKWVKYIFEEYVKKTPYKKIRDTLIENGVKSRRGKLIWSYGSIQSLIRNTHYFGSYIVKNHLKTCKVKNKLCECPDSVTVNCPPIFTETFKEKVEKENIRRSNTSSTVGVKKKESLLNDVLKCGECGEKFHYQNTIKQEPFYFCRNKRLKKCNKININMNGIDTIVWDLVIDILSKSYLYKDLVKVNVLQKSQKGQRKKELNELLRLQNRITDDISLIEQNLIKFETDKILKRRDPKLLKGLSEELTKEEKKLRKELKEIKEKISGFEKEDKWIDWSKEFGETITSLKSKRMNIEKKKVLINEMIDSIEVSDINEEYTKIYEYKYKYRNQKFEKLKNRHLNSVKVKFTLPIIQDELIYKNTKNKKKGYEIKNGKKVVNFKYETGLKKTELQSITYGNT